MKVRLKLILLMLPFLTGLLPGRALAVSNFNYDIQVNYHVNQDGSTLVTHAYTVVNNTPQQYLTNLKIQAPTADVSAIAAAYSDGTQIPFNAALRNVAKGDLSYKFQEVELDFPKQIIGYNRKWQFKVSYQVKGLVENRGGGRTVYIPATDPGGEGDKYHARVDLPLNFGAAHLAGAKSSAIQKTGDRQIYDFEQSDLNGQPLALQFGDQSVYHLDFNFPLKNSALWPRTVTVTLPPDTNNQKVYVEHLDPAPQATHLDSDGNILADYRLNSRQSLTVHTSISIEVNYREYDLSNSGTKSDIPADLISKYTGGSHFWPTGGAVAEAAGKASDSQASTAQNVQKIYQAVIDKLSYNSDKFKLNQRQGAAQALAHPNNVVCLEYSDLLVAMLRSQGIPARMAVGYAYSGSLKDSPDVADSLHTWAEAFVPGVGWMTLDPTWGEKFDQFGQAGLDHVAFAVWGQNDSSPAAEMSGGSGLGYQYENTKLDYLTKVEPLPPSPARLKASRQVLLPFVVIDHTQLTVPDQRASDNNQLLIDGRQVELGSLAPAERTVVNHLSITSKWMAAVPVDYRQQAGGQVKVLASATAPPAYQPLMLLAGVLAVCALWTALVRLIRSKG